MLRIALGMPKFVGQGVLLRHRTNMCHDANDYNLPRPADFLGASTRMMTWRDVGAVALHGFIVRDVRDKNVLHRIGSAGINTPVGESLVTAAKSKPGRVKRIGRAGHSG